MPTHKLPRKLVQRLRALARRVKQKDGGLERAYRFLGRMQTVDHRTAFLKKYSTAAFNESSTLVGGFRVRQMSVSRDYPGTNLVIKRAHGWTAKETIKKIKEAVKRHNSKYKPKDYVLVAPKAYAIAVDLIAMAKTDAPNLDEVIVGSKRGKDIAKKLGKKRLEQLLSTGFTVCKRAGIAYSNLFFLGERNGKFVFMPTLDIW